MTRAIDLGIVAAYLAVTAALSVWFWRKQTSTESSFSGEARSVPSWAMGTN